MSFLEKIQELGHSNATYFYEFLYRYDPKKQQVFAFYEGDEDPNFYSEIISRIVDEKCETEGIVVGCKNEVIKLYQSFDWEQYDCHQIAFFVDRDLSYWLGEKSEFGFNVFVTDGYSVENYVANSIGFRNWLCRFEGFARAKKAEIQHMVQIYEEVSVEFDKSIMKVMATAIVAKKRDGTIKLQDYKIPGHENLFNMLPNGKIEISNLDLKPSTMNNWGITPEDSEAVENQMAIFEEERDKFSVRGKWVLKFMAELGEFMRINAITFAPSLEKQKLAPTCSVPAAQCLSALAPYCSRKVPASLDAFLKNTYGYYCDSVKCLHQNTEYAQV